MSVVFTTPLLRQRPVVIRFNRTASLSLRLRRLSSLPRDRFNRFGQRDGRALHDVAAPLSVRDCLLRAPGQLRCYYVFGAYHRYRGNDWDDSVSTMVVLFTTSLLRQRRMIAC